MHILLDLCRGELLSMNLKFVAETTLLYQ